MSQQPYISRKEWQAKTAKEAFDLITLNPAYFTACFEQLAPGQGNKFVANVVLALADYAGMNDIQQDVTPVLPDNTGTDGQ